MTLFGAGRVPADISGSSIHVGQLDININSHEAPSRLSGAPGELGPQYRQLMAKFAGKNNSLPALLRDLAEQVEAWMERMSVEDPKGQA